MNGTGTLGGLKATTVPSSISRNIPRQTYGRFLSHLFPDWTHIFQDKLLIEKINDLRYTVDSVTSRLFRIDNAKLGQLRTSIA